MAERSKKEDKSFKDFLKDAPPVADVLNEDTVPVVGVVCRSDNEGKFVLATADGQALELSTEDVKNYEVVQETGPQKLVRVDVSSKALQAATSVGAIGNAAIRTLISDYFTRKELIKDPIFDHTRKELIKDPWTDPWTLVENQGTIQETIDPGSGFIDPAGEAGAGLTPFIMATPHHASAAAVAMQPGAAGAGAALTIKELPGDFTRKEVIKEPIFDTRKELIKDPITDPITWVEQIGTQVETIDPGIGQLVNPAVAGGGVPGFTAMQAQEAGAAPGLKTVIADTRITRKEIIFDTWKETIKDPIYDTRKEVFETYVEGIGTIQEGGNIDPGSIWQLPGMMF